MTDHTLGEGSPSCPVYLPFSFQPLIFYYSSIGWAQCIFDLIYAKWRFISFLSPFNTFCYLPFPFVCWEISRTLNTPWKACVSCCTVNFV